VRKNAPIITTGPLKRFRSIGGFCNNSSNYSQAHLTRKNKVVVFRESFYFVKNKRSFAKEDVEGMHAKDTATAGKNEEIQSIAFIGSRLKINVVFCSKLTTCNRSK